MTTPPRSRGRSSVTLEKSVNQQTTSSVSLGGIDPADDRQQHKVANGTEPVAPVYLYQKIYHLASEVTDRLENRLSLLKTLDLDKAPSQQSLSYAWVQCSEQTKRMLNAAATGIAQDAVDRGVVSEAWAPIIPDEDDIEGDGDEPTRTCEHVRKQGTKIAELTDGVPSGEFDAFMSFVEVVLLADKKSSSITRGSQSVTQLQTAVWRRSGGISGQGRYHNE